jgi:hypothetical protein
MFICLLKKRIFDKFYWIVNKLMAKTVNNQQLINF